MKTFNELSDKQVEHNMEVLEKTDKEMAVIELLDLDVEEWNDVNKSSYNEDFIEYGNQEYLVLTDDEADDAWEEDLDNYIEECVLSELPKAYRNYFDDEKFKNDCRTDGRGHSLNRYDGNEEEANGYYIYRQN